MADDTVQDANTEHPEDSDEKKLEKEIVDKLDKIDARVNDDQKNYDVDRESIDDSQSEKQKADQESKKWNDDTRSDNWVNGKKNISVTAYMQVQNMIPPVQKAIIGHNEYFQLPKSRLPELPADAREEIVRIHGSQIYSVLDNDSNIPEYAVDGIHIPTRTQNMPRYFESKDIEENFTHDDVFRSNLELFESIRASKDANKKKMVL